MLKHIPARHVGSVCLCVPLTRSSSPETITKEGIIVLDKPSGETVHISSLIVQVRPEYMDAVVEKIGSYSDAEVNLTSPKGKIVMTMETQNRHLVTDCIEELEQLDGVINAVLVFHQAEEANILDDLVDIDLPNNLSTDIVEQNR